MMKPREFVAALFVASALLAGCSGAQKKTSTAGAAAAAPAAAPAEPQEASLRSKSYELDPDIKSIYFDLDSYRFSDEDLAILKANAEKLKAKADTALLIEGHADDRGTIAYNLALGQERAQAVKEYYQSLGIPLNRMSTISYGELKPVCHQEDEACWRQNRRADTKLGVPEAAP
ncbi:MAG TPA: OmpA family protein [Elusimicrobiota bacterium]|jgi:peptidoglycan-associated lipoprotein|nr:OmpA family protein [Elusimicrobiota bacterium]